MSDDQYHYNETQLSAIIGCAIGMSGAPYSKAQEITESIMKQLNDPETILYQAIKMAGGNA